MIPEGPPASGPPAPPALDVSPPGGFANTRTGHLPKRAVLLVAPITIIYTLAMVCIVLRVWGKRIKKNVLRFNDYAIFVAAIFATAYLSICWLGKGQVHICCIVD
jgi:hypothetical protein